MMFTPHQADAVRRALRKGLDQEGPPSQGLDARLRDALADKGRARFTADQKDDVRSALRASEEKNLRVDLGAALAGPEGLPTTDVDGPDMLPMPPVVQEPPMPPKAEPMVPEVVVAPPMPPPVAEPPAESAAAPKKKKKPKEKKAPVAPKQERQLLTADDDWD